MYPLLQEINSKLEAQNKIFNISISFAQSDRFKSNKMTKKSCIQIFNKKYLLFVVLEIIGTSRTANI